MVPKVVEQPKSHKSRKTNKDDEPAAKGDATGSAALVPAAGAEAAAAPASASRTKGSAKGRGGGGKGGKGKSENYKAQIKKFEDFTKWKLFENIVLRIATLVQIQDAEIRDLLAVSDIVIYAAPESHPGVLALRDRYQDYLQDLQTLRDKAKADSTEFVSYPPQAMLYIALLTKMLEKEEDFTEDQCRALNNELDIINEAEDEAVNNIVTLIRCTKAFSAKAQEKKFKVRLMLGSKDRNLKAAMNIFFSKNGASKKVGVAPKGASIRDLATMVELFHRAEDETW